MSVDRSDGAGAGLAIAGHVALFVLLTLGIAHREPPKHFEQQPIDVQLVDTVGLQSASPSPATEAPQQQTAPEKAPLEEAKAAAPQPTPKPAPAPPKPVVKEVAAPVPSPKPVKAPAPAKPAPAKPDLALSRSLLADLKATAKAEGKGTKSTGSKLGPDFLKGIDSSADGKGKIARVAMSGAAANGLAAAIFKQVKPCYDLGPLAGTPAMKVITTFRLRYNTDGSVAGSPQMEAQEGVDGSNRAYAKQMEEVGRRAILRCQPLKLPAELYDYWKDFPMRFIPEQLG